MAQRGKARKTNGRVERLAIRPGDKSSPPCFRRSGEWYRRVQARDNHMSKRCIENLQSTVAVPDGVKCNKVSTADSCGDVTRSSIFDMLPLMQSNSDESRKPHHLQGSRHRIIWKYALCNQANTKKRHALQDSKNSLDTPCTRERKERHWHSTSQPQLCVVAGTYHLCLHLPLASRTDEKQGVEG